MNPRLWLKSQPKNRMIPFRDRYRPSSEAERLAYQEKRNQYRMAAWHFHFLEAAQ